MEKIIYNIENISDISRDLISEMDQKTVCLFGPMGSGKTTLVKAIVAQLGAADTGNSPSFGLVNEYHDTKGNLMSLHYDCYRLKDEEEALDMGMEELLETDCWHFIEWPEKIPNLLPESYTSLSLKIISPTTRELSIW